MKTLANSDDVAEVIARLRGLRPDSPRGWGKMSQSQMVCHCIDAFRVSLGEVKVGSVSKPFATTLLKWFVLYAPFHWPKNVPTGKPSDQNSRGTQPADLSNDIADLEKMTHRFVLSKKQNAMLEHPFFGPMTDSEWLRWGYLHLDHHLRQFYL